MDSKYCPQNTVGSPTIMCISLKGILLLILIFYMIYSYIKKTYDSDSDDKMKIDSLNDSLQKTKNDLHKEKIKKMKLQNEYNKYLNDTNLNKTYNDLIEKIEKSKNNYDFNNNFDFREPKKMPINIKTRGQDEPIQQQGTLTKLNFSTTSGPGTSPDSIIIPLMGRRPYNRSNKMIYYTIYNSMRIPIKNKGRDCDSEYGCDELFTDDIIEIPELNGQFKVNIYKNQALQYIPY